MTNVPELLAALELQAEVGSRVRIEQLDVASPCAGWTVRDVLSHSIGVTSKFADFAAGATDEPRAPSGDLVGGDHVAALRRCADRAAHAWQSVDLRRVCRLPFGTFTADAAAGINLLDVLAHTWDVAAAATVDLDERDPLWTSGMVAAQAVIGIDRDPQHYGEEVPIADDATPMLRFIAYLGRRVVSPH